MKIINIINKINELEQLLLFLKKFKTKVKFKTKILNFL